MELSQLRYFLAVANCGQIATAAASLHVSQSAISMSISRLEKELGVKLFERGHRSIRLSKIGKRFVELISPAMAELDFAQRQIIAMERTEPDVIAMSVETPDFAIGFERIFYQCHPNIRFRQSLDNTEQTRQKLMCNMIDFTLTFEPFQSPEICSLHIMTEPALVQLSSAHPLYSAEALWLSQLKDTPFVSFSAEFSFRRWTDGMCYLAGFCPEVCFEVCDTQSLMSFVQSNNAAAFIGKSTWESNNISSSNPTINDFSIRAIPLLDSCCTRSIYLSCNKNRILTPAAQEFWKYAGVFQELFAQHQCLDHVETLIQNADS